MHLLWEAILFFYLYGIVSLSLYLIASPFLILLSFKKKYEKSIPARFFLWKNPPLKPDGIWFHSCSFGEAKAIKPIVDALPPDRLRMTTTTQTGKSVIDAYTAQSRYLPFEPLLWFWLRRQKVLVVMEAELWFLLFALAKRRGAKTMLINARMSDRSFPKYMKMRWFYRRLFHYVDVVYAQTDTDRRRLEQLGAKGVKVAGNIKLAALPSPQRNLRKPDRFVVCAASTHEGEEKIALDAFEALKKERSDAMLLVVPRHPERFEKVWATIERYAKKNRWKHHRFSRNERLEGDVVLIDRLGALVDMYAVSDLVILGGSFVPVGGHNAAEAAQFGCRIISGPHYFNQKEIFDAIEGIVIVDASNLAKRVVQYGLVKPAKIVQGSNLAPIVTAIEATTEEFL